MLYRMQLSKRRPEWIDENGEPFIYYSLKEVMRDISCGEKKALQLFKELEEAHLIRRRSQCQFSTPRIYIPTNRSSGWHFQNLSSSAYVFMIKYFDYVFMIRVFMIRV